MILRNCNIEKFLDRIKGKKLVCFGAGDNLGILCDMFSDYGFWSRIEYILDNSKQKQGGYFEYKGGRKRIDGIESFIERGELSDSVFIITSSLYYYEIFHQLNAIPTLLNTECYLGELMAFNPIDYELPIHDASEKQLIPKTIHYCWFGRNPIPAQGKENINSWRKYCPDYEIIEWNEDNYDVMKNKYMQDAYNAKKWSFVSDYARLDIIYNNGGIYLDTDVELIKNLDCFLYDRAFMALSHNFTINIGSGVGAVKYHHIIREMRDLYNNLSFINEDGTLNLTSAPIYHNEFMSKYGLKPIMRPTYIEDIMLYPVDVLTVFHPHYRFAQFTKNSYAIHYCDGSWLDESRKVFREEETAKIRELLSLIKEEETRYY